MQIIGLLSAAAVVLLLTRNRGLRAVLAAAVISSASTGLWMALLPRVFPALDLRDTRADPANVPVAIAVLYSMVEMLGLTIVPNLVALGAVRRFLWAGQTAGTMRWATRRRRALVVPVGVLYGELNLVITIVMWSVLLVLVLVLRSANSMNVLLKYLLYVILHFSRYPLLHLTAVLGGITAIGLQVAFDQRGLAPAVPASGITKG